MILFLMFSLPVFTALVVSFWREPLKDIKYILLSGLTGLLVFLVAALLTWSWIRALAPRACFFSRYAYLLFSAHGIFILLGSVGALLIHLRKTVNGGAGDHFRELFVYFSGFFFGMNLQMVVLKENWYGFTELFCYPLLTLSAVIIATFLINRFLTDSGNERFLWIGLLAAAVLIIPMVLLPSWFKTAFLTPLITLIVSGGSIIMLVLEIRGTLPGSSVRI